jgi:hypothetical protein
MEAQLKVHDIPKLKVLRAHLRMEVNHGVKIAGVTWSSLIKRELGMKGNKQKVLAELESAIEELEQK